MNSSGKRSTVKMTPLMKQYYEIKKLHPDSLILFRMGDFFETFDDDAKTASRILDITLTKRANGAAADVPLAGFPHHALDSYLPKLVAAGLRVAICEQVEDPKLAKGIVKREVIEVVTPGTATADSSSSKRNNFLGAVFSGHEKAGFAFLDHSTGEFYIGECPEDSLTETILKYAPREIIVEEGRPYHDEKWHRRLKPFITEMDEWAFDYKTTLQSLTEHFGTTSLKPYGCDDLQEGVAAAGVILSYVQRNIPDSVSHVTRLRRVRDENVMGLDAFTVRNLELFHSLATQGTHGTLISILDDTVTPGGGRLLRRRLLYPLVERSEIERRLELVDGFEAESDLRSEIRRRLTNCSDLERNLSRLSRGKGAPRDAESISSTLTLMPEICAAVSESSSKTLQSFVENIPDTEEIVAKINSTLKDDVPALLNKGGVIRDGVDSELDELRSIASGGKEWIAAMQDSERKATGISSLKVGYNKVFGYYLSVTKTHIDKVPEHYIRKQTLVNAERYITPELKEYEEKILTSEEKILAIEIRIFDELRKWILSRAQLILQSASLLNKIDLHSTLAEVAVRNSYVKPTITDEPRMVLKDSRHPVVEAILPAGEEFVRNDLEVDNSKSQILLITGPNMAGKSTYLRQIGLVTVMAQMGSFVPTREAEIGIVDRLFTRVGASDNLAGGESTFLVEMIEAANILNNATPKSLIIFDEIGRGTATFDGLSLAWAITEFVHNTEFAQARTLFATHYHELTELEELLERVVNYNVAVKEFGDKIVFLRKIIPGPSDKSYGIHVAKMAGLPGAVINRATEILSHLIRHEAPEIDGTEPPQDASKQITLFQEEESKLRKKLAELEINDMTPLEALEELDRLKSEYGL